jgi:hypothetical protein
MTQYLKKIGYDFTHIRQFYFDRNGIRTVVKMPPFGTSSFWSNLEGIIVLSKKALNI